MEYEVTAKDLLELIKAYFKGLDKALNALIKKMDNV